jgi:hypothetical protein
MPRLSGPRGVTARRRALVSEKTRLLKAFHPRHSGIGPPQALPPTPIVRRSVLALIKTATMA